MVDDVFDLHGRNLAALKTAGLDVTTLQPTPRVSAAAQLGPITRPGRWDKKVEALATNKQSAGTLMIVGGGVGWDSELCLQAAAARSDKAQAASAAGEKKKRTERAALKEKVVAIRALGLEDAALSGKQLGTLLRYKMQRQGGASKFTQKAAMLAQYQKVKGDASDDEDAAAPALPAPPPLAAAAVEAPSPGADWKRVDVGKLSGVELDAHLLMLQQERARRAVGCVRRRVLSVDSRG